MAQPGASVSEMIRQLEAARKLVLADAQIYTQILPGILPIIGPTAQIEVRRWGAEFLAEAFATPALANAQKEELSSEVLPYMRSTLETPGEDDAVVKSVIQAAASLYPLVFRRVTVHPDQALLWNDVNVMKMNILKRMDTASVGIRVCCIKFIQKVAQVQTPGVIADPRRPERNETSIALVPRNHPLLPLPNLEAEASGLLDRLLSVFQEPTSDPIMIDATLNCLAVLIRTRPAVSNKILSAILTFNPLKQSNTPMTPRLKVVVRSLERTTRALLRNVLKNNPNGPLAPKIDAYLTRIDQSRATLLSEAPSLKRPAPAEPTDGLDDAKRQRIVGPRKFPHLPPPPNSYADLFTLTEDNALKQFDVKLLPADMVNTISSVLLQHVNPQALDEAIQAVKGRYAHLQKLQQPTPVPLVPMAGPTGIDDEDDYDPEYEPFSDASPATQNVLEELAQPVIELGPFELAKPPPLTGAEVSVLSQQTVSRVFEVVASLDAADAPARPKLGLNRLAASTNDRDAWITIVTRLATRTPTSLDASVTETNPEDQQDSIHSQDNETDVEKPTLANGIRQNLYMYVLEDFRPRLNVAISWLNEEWYSDKLRAKTNPLSGSLPNYFHWTRCLLDALLPYLDARDNKLLIRFLSEIPAVDEEILEKVKSLARDPERVNMCMMALQYLILMRPPVRTQVIDVIEGIWRDDTFREAKGAAAKVLNKWRPGVTGPATNVVDIKHEQIADVKMNGQTNGDLTNDKSLAPKVDIVDPRKKISAAASTILVVGGTS